MKKSLAERLPVWAWSLAAAGVALGLYLLVLALFDLSGFPLDDAWIHQTYARSLALHGQWSFWPGQVSAGSTSPLWTLLLVPGQLLPGLMLPWTYLLGWLALAGCAWLGQSIFQRLSGQVQLRFPVMAFFLALEWHLVWAAGSGMETLLAALLMLAVFNELSRSMPRYGLAGGLAGLTVWVRPDGLTLLGPILFVAVLTAGNVPSRIKRMGWALLGFLAVFLPYIAFNWLLAGTLWPNTYYAKQTEYTILMNDPLVLRYLKLLAQPLIGAGILLLSGVVWVFIAAIRQHRPVQMAMCLFWLGFTFLYAWRLPVVYQHARYLIPVMPVFFILGLSGMFELVAVVSRKSTARMLRFGWVSAIALVLLGFFITGGLAYRNDVGIIQTEMVATAKWIQQNTPEDALIAAHDIGALGYYGDRQLVDLAGLISPDVIPFIRDEVRLKTYLDKKNVDYLVTFPGWYTSLAEGKPIVFQTSGNYSPAQGGENMAVYRWR